MATADLLSARTCQGKPVLEFIGKGLANWQVAERMFLARKVRHE